MNNSSDHRADRKSTAAKAVATVYAVCCNGHTTVRYSLHILSMSDHGLALNSVYVWRGE